MTSRRGFIAAILAAGAAPAIVRAQSLMPIWVPPVPKIWIKPQLTDEELLRRFLPPELQDGLDMTSGWWAPARERPMELVRNIRLGVYEVRYL